LPNPKLNRPRKAIKPAHLRKKLRTTNGIERCFVEARRRTRPMVVL
jgi:transposase-like protein